MGTLTLTIVTTSTVNGTAPQNLTKTFTDTDANVVLALQAMQWRYSAPTLGLGALGWANAVVNHIKNDVINWQQLTAPTTGINPI